MNHLRHDLQNELMTANQLLRLISVELQQIKDLTNPGGPIENNLIKNANVMKILADIQQVDLENLPPFVREQVDTNMFDEQDEF